MTLGTEGATGFVPFVEGGDAALVWGLQGGIMLTPTLQVDGVLGGDFDVSLRLEPDPAHPRPPVAAMGNSSPSYPPRGSWIGPYFYQVSNNAHDQWVRLIATVRAGGRSGEATVTLHLVDANVNTAATNRLRPASGSPIEEWRTIDGCPAMVRFPACEP